ncbi:MAG: DUF4397 domain-containing protein [Armatimonadetes bacterium]|nr:DUF4397 domain-containing protein [Armatimonadota bacterium]
MLKTLNRFRVGLLATAFGFLAIGCGGGGSDPSLPDPRVYFVNCSPDAAALNLRLDDDIKAVGDTFLTVAPKTTVLAGERDVVINENGNPFEHDAHTTKFDGNTDWVIAAIGKETFGTEYSKRIRTVAFKVNLSDPPSATKARLVVLHAYQRQAGFETPGVDFQSPGNNPLYSVTGLNFGDQKSIDVDPGLQDFQVRRTGTENVLIEQSTTLSGGKVYLVVCGGIEGAVGGAAPIIKFIPLN